MRRSRGKGKHQNRWRVRATILIIIIILGGFTILYINNSFNRITGQEISNTNEDLDIVPSPTVTQSDENTKEVKNKEESQEHKENQKDEGSINVLFFGVDRRDPDEASRSDCIMVFTMDKGKEKVKITSILRDTYVSIPGHGSNRINAAYAFGGPALSIKTINSNFGLDIQQYITVDFFGFEKVIDRIGGVDIDIKEIEIKEVNNCIKEVSNLQKDGNNCLITVPGFQTLNGRQAVAYARIRYVGNSDYERTERQRRVLGAIFKKVRDQSILDIPDIVSTILPYVETNMEKGELLNIVLKAIEYKTDTLEEFRIPVDGHFSDQYIRGMAVLVPDIETNKKLLLEFIDK